MIDPRGALELLTNLEPTQSFGKVNKVVGLIVEGCGIKAPLGAVCQLIPEDGAEQIPAEVVGFRDGNILFMPYGDMRGIKPGSLIRNSSLPPNFPVGNDMLTVNDKGGNGAALNDLEEGFFLLVKFGFDLFKTPIALHDDVGGLQKAVMDTVLDGVDGNRLAGQVLEGLFPNGFQPQQVPQETGVLVIYELDSRRFYLCNGAGQVQIPGDLDNGFQSLYTTDLAVVIAGMNPPLARKCNARRFGVDIGNAQDFGMPSGEMLAEQVPKQFVAKPAPTDNGDVTVFNEMDH